MLIQVTQEHIDSGIRSNCYSCPIALALREANPEQRCAANVQGLCIGNKRYPTPKNVIFFIEEFDFHCPVQPFEFELC